MEGFSDVFAPARSGEVIGAGLDLVRVDRARRFLEAHDGLVASALLDRPWPGRGERQSPEAFAILLAEMEAVAKALGDGVPATSEWPWWGDGVGAVPSLRLRPRTLERMRERGVSRVLFNIGEAAEICYALTVFWRDGHER